MEVETGDFQDWEVLHNSVSDSIEDMKGLEDIEGDSEGIIRSDYFSLDSQSKYSRTIGDGDVIEEVSVESDNPSWIDPGSETGSPMKELGEFWSDSGSDRSDDRKFGEIKGRNELVSVENAKGQVGSDGIEEIVVMELGNSETVKARVGSDGIVAESENSGKLWYDSSGIEDFVENIEMGVGGKANLLDGVEVSDEKEDVDQLMERGGKRSEEGDVIGAMASGGGEKRIMFWWKLPLELLKYFVFRISPVWTISMAAAAAAMGFVILGRQYYMMKRKSRSMQLKVTMDDKKVSQFMSRAARLNEAFSVVKRVPIIRPSLPVAGVTPWPMMTWR